MLKRTSVFNLALGGIIILLFFLNFYQRSMFRRPNSIHQWRQTDCLSITKNYYEEGMHFFEPKLHNQVVKDGKAVSECPVMNYSVAALWKVFGEHEFIYRLLAYAIFLCAVFFSFNTLLARISDGWMALMLPLTLLTSPLLVYYSLNFLADVPALSLAIISFCFLYRFTRGYKERNYYLAILSGTIAVLMKASALVPLGLTLLTGASLLLKDSRYHLTGTAFMNKTKAVLASLLSVLIIFAWYRYAIWYNNNDKTNIFLLTVLPIWEMGEEQIIYNLKKLFNNFFPAFLSRPMFFFVLCLAIYVSANFRRLEPLLKWAFVCSGLYFVFYLLIFYQVFNVHEYYLINLFVFPVITVFSAIVILTADAVTDSYKRVVKPFIILLFIFNGLYAAAFYRLRTIKNDGLSEWMPFISKQETEEANYLFWRYGNDLERIEHFTPVLRAAGISRYDMVMSIPDESLNISLYMMDQKGHPIGRHNMINDTAAMDEYIGRVKYIVLSDTNLKNTGAFERHRERVQLYFTHNAVQVFKVGQ